MNEKAITLTVFFISVFLLYQIRFIVRLGKLRKRNGNFQGILQAAELLFCCSEPCCDLGCACAACAADSAHTEYDRQTKKRDIKKSDEFEQKESDRRKREQKNILAEIEQEKIRRKEKVEILRANGYTVAEKVRIKVIETVSISTETNLSWTSATTKIPIEEIIIIIEDEPDFEIEDEMIINKKKIRIAETTCPNCENRFESGSEFCPNCGLKLKN